MPVSKRVALSVAIVATVAVGAYAGWTALRGDRGQTAATVAETVAPPSTKPVTATSVAPVADDRVFRFTRVTTEAGGAVAEACLVFSKPLDETGGVNYADYVDLPAEVKAGFRVAREKLCLSGLGFGRDYDVGLRPGLPAAANGGALAEAQNVTLALNDRPPAVALGQGFILPRETGDGLPITTVNVDRLSIKLYRVGDRMLARMRQDFVDERSIYPYSAREVQEDEGRLVWQGEIPVQGPRNSAVTTLFPLTEAVGRTEPGAYLLVASNPDAPRQGEEGEYYYSDDYRPQAGQWVVQSDLGVTSFRGDDGLTLSIRSLASAKPLSGVRLSLIARNNEVLGEAKSDGKGMARFDAGLLRGEGDQEIGRAHV